MNPSINPSIRLQAAKRAYDTALSNCAHWDYESNEHSIGSHECCHTLEAAHRELALAKVAVRRV